METAVETDVEADRKGMSRVCPNVLTLQRLFLLLPLVLLCCATRSVEIPLSLLLRTAANHGLEVPLVLRVKVSGMAQGISCKGGCNRIDGGADGPRAKQSKAVKMKGVGQGCEDKEPNLDFVPLE